MASLIIDDYRVLIESALVHGKTHRFKDVKAMIENGDAQFWPGAKSVIVTQAIQYPLSKVLYIWVAAGERSEILEKMLPVIEAWGRSVGCTRTMFTGRVGWQRVLRDDAGWTTTAVCMEKPL